MVWPRSIAALSLLDLPFMEQGQPEKTHLAKKWRILHAGQQHVPSSNTVSLGAGKSRLIVAAATEG